MYSTEVHEYGCNNFLPPTHLVLPTSATGNGSLALIVIQENDDARGIVELSSATYDAEEPLQDFVTVNRDAGTFGTVLYLYFITYL